MHEKFSYKSGDALLKKTNELGIELPYTDDFSPLFKSCLVDGFLVPNRLVVQPMEGYDSRADGSPSELTIRRYLRYAAGGSGMIWYEAVAVSREGRSNPNQLWINESNVNSYTSLNDDVRRKAEKSRLRPLLVIQLTDSGRYSKPNGKSMPRAAAANSLLDRVAPRILTDDELKLIQDQYVEAAKLSAASGFDAIDIKACHGYLIIDLLAARGRSNSIYGGEDPSRRFRFLLETIDRVKSEVPGLIITSRLNISDLYAGGFGVDENGNADFSEPLMLVDELKQRGINLINLSMGSPYHNASITRPFDTPLPGHTVPEEHPLAGVVRMIEGTAIFQRQFRDMAIVGSAYSYLRQFIPNVAAEVIRRGEASFIGLGRSSFAYPDLPADLMNTGKIDPAKVCISCSGCTRLIRNLHPGGCVIRDRAIYGNELKKLIADGK